MLIRLVLVGLTLQFSFQVFAQNTWGPITRPFTQLHSAIAPGSIGFENNLMNHISDELRLDSEGISKYISCHPEANGQIVHRKGGRVIPVTCYGNADLDFIRGQVSQKYGHHIGSHLKYAVRSGNYVFAICNYDEKSDHQHSKDHYVCRTPLSGLSQINSAETFCYKMGTFHRTCNPHKALVSTEILLLNSKRRWPSIDKTILVRFLAQKKTEPADGDSLDRLITDIAEGTVYYSDRSRGSADSQTRFPKTYVGKNFMCAEDFVSSDDHYLETKIQCGPIKSIVRTNQNMSLVFERIDIDTKLKKVKQSSVYYPMISPEKSSVD